VEISYALLLVIESLSDKRQVLVLGTAKEIGTLAAY